jgi:2-dehydro-3-deoxygluconokinase
MSEVLTIGEPMALFAVEKEEDTDKELKDATSFAKYLAGAEVNVCVGLARLGHTVDYITQIGQDPYGDFIKDKLASEKIGTAYVSSTDQYFTGSMLKNKVSKGDPKTFYFRRNSATAHFDAKMIDKINFDGVKIVHLSGIFPALSKECKEAFARLAKLAHEHGTTITYDPNLRPALWPNQQVMADVINSFAFQSDIVIPGIAEGKILAGSDDPDRIADFYLDKGVKTVIVKVGAKGAFIKNKQGSKLVTGYKVDKVVDTVGAGDGFAVGLISGLLEELSLEESVKRGNAIGALAVMSPGDNDGYPDRNGLETFMSRNK